jgi:hypothetical protein
MKCALVLVFALLTAPVAAAQILAVGVKGGALLSEQFEGADAPSPPPTVSETPTFSSDPKRAVWGFAAEFAVSRKWSIEVDALRRRFAYSSARVSGNPGFPWDATASTDGRSWEFPVMVKRRLSQSSLRPYVTAGGSVLHFAKLLQTERDLPPGETGISLLTDVPRELDRRTVAGATLAVGLEQDAKFLRLSTEVRYTRWLARAFRDPRGSGFRSELNQAEILFGVAVIRLP